MENADMAHPYSLLKNYCGSHLLRCAVLASSPTYKVCLVSCVTCALHMTILATFFNKLLVKLKNYQAQMFMQKPDFFKNGFAGTFVKAAAAVFQ